MFSNLPVSIVLVLAVLGEAARIEGHGKRHARVKSCTAIANSTIIASGSPSTVAAAQNSGLPSSGRKNTISWSTLAVTTPVSSLTGSNGISNSTMALVTSTRRTCGSEPATMSVDTTTSIPPISDSTFISNGEVFVTSTISAITSITIMQCPPDITQCPDHQKTHTMIVTTTIPVFTTVCPLTASIGTSDIPIASATPVTSFTDAATFSTATSETTKAIQTAPPANNNVQDDITTTIVMTSFSTTIETVFATSSPAASTEANGLESTKSNASTDIPNYSSNSAGSCPPQVTVTVNLPAVTITVLRSKLPCTQNLTTLVTASTSSPPSTISNPSETMSNGTTAIPSKGTSSISSLPVSSGPAKVPCKLKVHTEE